MKRCKRNHLPYYNTLSVDIILPFSEVTFVAVESRSEIVDIDGYLHYDERMFSWTLCSENENRKDAGKEWEGEFVTHFAY